MGRTSMRKFWDDRAAEDPFYFVDSRLEYGKPDTHTFWAEGVKAIEVFERELEFTIGPEDVLVEIGCGLGRVTRVLATRAKEVIAVDVSEVMLERAKELNPNLQNVQWVLGDGRTLGVVDDATVEGCFSFVTFQHLPEAALIAGYIREMARILKPGGWAAFQLSTLPEPAWRPNRLRRLWLAAGARVGRRPRGQGHPAWVGSTLPEPELRHEIEHAGLRRERLAFAGTMFSLVLARKAPQR